VRGNKTDIQQLLTLIDGENYVSWSRRIDNSEVMRDIMWAHPDSVKLLNLFPIVLIMDSTYKTNKYRLSLLKIVGMTSTKCTFAVAFAYMESERKENFCWVLEKLKGMFIKEGLFPQVILTDRDLALMNAIEIVFPNSVNLLCQFHIDKNVRAKCKKYISKDMQKEIQEIIASFQKSFYEVEHAHTSPFYEKLRGFVSRAALTRIVVEFERVRYTEIDESTCGCRLKTTYGLPCAYELGRYKISGIPIPLDSIHIQWKKLSMESQQEEDTDTGSELDMTDAIEEIWKRFRSLDIIGKRALKSKVLEHYWKLFATSERFVEDIRIGLSA